MLSLAFALLLQVDQSKVDIAVENGAKFLTRKRIEPIKHPFQGEFVPDELILYALISAGYQDDATFKGMFERMLAAPLTRTYNVSLQALVLEELDKNKYQIRIMKCAQWLIDTQAKNGQWGYGLEVKETDVATDGGNGNGGVQITLKRRQEGPLTGDNSNSQIAALALRACANANIKFPKETFEAAMKWWEKAQAADGSWGYHENGATNEVGYGSMTAGGVSSLCILKSLQKIDIKKDKSESIKKGLDWMAANLKWDENPKYSLPKIWRYYWIYGIERVGILADAKKIGTHDWYTEGANKLLSEQKGEGSWKAGENENESVGGAVADTCFAILFLKKATKVLPKVATGTGK